MNAEVRALTKYPSWQKPKALGEDSWMYFTLQGIEIYHQGELLTTLPLQTASRYVRQRAALKVEALPRKTRTKRDPK